MSSVELSREELAALIEDYWRKTPQSGFLQMSKSERSEFVKNRVDAVLSHVETYKNQYPQDKQWHLWEIALRNEGFGIDES